MSANLHATKLQQIAALARAGRLDAAAMMVEQVRVEGHMDPTLAALGGAMYVGDLLYEAGQNQRDDCGV